MKSILWLFGISCCARRTQHEERREQSRIGISLNYSMPLLKLSDDSFDIVHLSTVSDFSKVRLSWSKMSQIDPTSQRTNMA
jgi:hypothetical protein